MKAADSAAQSAVDRAGTSVNARAMTSGWRKCVAAAMSGVLAALAFPPYGFAWLAWVAMMPLLAALGNVEGRRPGWKGFGIGYLGGAVSCLIQFHWVDTVSWLGALALPLYLADNWGFFGWYAATLGRPRESETPATNLLRAFCMAAVWAGLELARGWIITGFGWNSLGVAFLHFPAFAQGADLLGVTGLSMLLIFTQTAVLGAVRAALRGKCKLRWDIAAAALLILTAFIYGKFRIAGEAARECIRLKALMVQINIPQEAQTMLWTDLEIHRAYEEETLKALEKLKLPDGTLSSSWPDWVIWPETALTGRILRSDDGGWGTWQINLDTVSQVRGAGPFSLIYGVNELEAEPAGDQLAMKEHGRAWNSLAVMSPDDELQTYRKRHLVIFGETIPFIDSLPFLKTIYEEQSGTKYGGSFTPGESLEPLVATAANHTVGIIPTICFEDSVPRLTRKFLRPGPQVIVNVTNDGWFKRSAAADQHFAYASFRAIELRRPMLRCANTGVTAAIDSTGSTANPDTGARQVLVDETGSHFTRGALLADVDIPIHPAKTLFGTIGDLGVLSLAILALAVSYGRRRAAS
jgi:apolipoprotein N-acyltransferase